MLGAANAQVYADALDGRSLASLVESSAFSDVSVTGPDGIKKNRHKVILASQSGFFERALTAELRERDEGHISLGFPDPQGVWPLVLGYLYSGKVSITKETCFGLYAMAVQLDVPKLQKHCKAFVDKAIVEGQALAMLAGSLAFEETKPLGRPALQNIALNFPLFWNWDFSFLGTCKAPTVRLSEHNNQPQLTVRFYASLYNKMT